MKKEKRENERQTVAGILTPVYATLCDTIINVCSFILRILRILPTFFFIRQVFIKKKKIGRYQNFFLSFYRMRSILSALSLYSTSFFHTFSRETRVIDRRTTSLTSPTPSRSGDKIFPSFFEQRILIIFFAIINVSHSLKCY